MAKIKKADVDTQILNLSQALSAIPNCVVTPNDVRLALMDYTDYNIPLYKEELDDAKIWKCIEWGIDTFNETPPTLSTTYTGTNFPDKKLLLDLAVVEALRLTALIELRGEMQYSDGGIQSTVYYKSPQFTSLRQELEQKTSQAITSIKRSKNINECYGELC